MFAILFYIYFKNSIIQHFSELTSSKNYPSCLFLYYSEAIF